VSDENSVEFLMVKIITDYMTCHNNDAVTLTCVIVNCKAFKIMWLK